MPHYVELTIDPGEWPRLRFRCTEPVTGDCHAYCNGDHEEWRRDEGDPSLCWYCGRALLQADECQILLFDDLDEGFAGDAGTVVRAGEVTFTWNGDCYEWVYAQPAAEPAVGA
jgi:hypothetical protein